MNTEAVGVKTRSFFKEIFPHFAFGIFWRCGGRKLLFGVCLEVEYQVSSGDDLGPKST